MENNWVQGDINPETGKIYWSRHSGCKDGIRWMTIEQFDRQKAKIKEHQNKPEYRIRQNQLRDNEHSRIQRNEYAKIWRNNDEQRDKSNAYARKRRLENPLVNMAERVRARIKDALRYKSYTKRSSCSKILGCDWETFKIHIESKFTDGMTWNNRGDWHLDHIKPLAKAENEEELIKLFHYTNLQPLWAMDNFYKGCK